MNGRLGSITITPDQMQALNPILILAFIPIFQFVVYPLFNKCHLLRRLVQWSIDDLRFPNISIWVKLSMPVGAKANIL